jgi:predicted nucleotidyltransferase
MDIKQKLFQELILFAKKYLSHLDHFMYVYGSYGSEGYNNKSDIDLFVVAKEFNKKDFEKICDFVINLHICNNLVLDNEVPYENKLVVSYKDMESAIALKSFIKEENNYFIPTVKKNKTFLSSKEIRWRLLLNALTSPHVYLCGNKQKYFKFKDKAEKAIIILADGLTQEDNSTIDDKINVLFSGVNNEEGEMYLGYKKEREEVVKYLRELIIRNNLTSIK